MNAENCMQKHKRKIEEKVCALSITNYNIIDS